MKITIHQGYIHRHIYIYKYISQTKSFIIHNKGLGRREGIVFVECMRINIFQKIYTPEIHFYLVVKIVISYSFSTETRRLDGNQRN